MTPQEVRDRRPRCYLSGPITRGNRNQHFFRAAEAEKALMLAGFAPLNPMRSIVLPFAWEDCMPHELWLAVDKAWVEVADAVIRLEGDSRGADEECDFAAQLGIPIFYCFSERGQSFEVAFDKMLNRLTAWRESEYRRLAETA